MTRLTTHSGAVLDLMNPTPLVIDIRDIAVHLSRIARFNGATVLPYYVAQHSVLVARIAAKLGASHTEQMIALLHDAHEAYLGDIARPVAQALGESSIEQLRHALDRAIFKAFGLVVETLPEMVLRADEMALATEWRDLMRGDCGLETLPVPWPVKPKRHDMAEHEFLEEFHRLQHLANLTPSFAAIDAHPSGQLLR